MCIKNTDRIYLMVTLILFMVSQGVFAQNSPLKSIELKDYEKEKEKQKLALQRREFTEYDVNGRVLSQEQYGRNFKGELVKLRVTKYKYGRKENYQNVESFDSLGKSTNKELFITDRNGRKIKSVLIKTLSMGYYSLTSHYKYDGKGNLEKMTMYDLANKLVGEETRKYNKLGEEIKTEKWYYDPLDYSKSTSESKATEYDEMGGIAQTILNRTEYNKTSSKQFKEVVKFQNNMLTEWFKYTEGQLTSHYVKGNMATIPNLKAEGGKENKAFATFATDTEYDEEGNKVKTTYFEGDLVVQVSEFSYNEKGQLTKTVKKMMEADGVTLASMEEDLTEYDTYGNVIRKAVLNNGEITSEQVFAYEYYNR